MTEIISNKGPDGEPVTYKDGSIASGVRIIAYHTGGLNASDGDIFITQTDTNGEYSFTDRDLPATYAIGGTVKEDTVHIFAELGSPSNPRQAVPIRPWQPYSLEGTIPASVNYQWEADSLSLSDGDEVLTWSATTGGINLSSTGSPIFRSSGIKGEPAVEYNGVDEAHQSASAFTITQPNALYVVCKQDANTKHRVVTNNGSQGGSRQFLTLENSGPRTAMYAGSFLGNGDYDDTNPHILGGYFDGSNSELRVDGSVEATGDAGSQDLDGLTVGANNIIQSNFFKGKIAEVLIAESPSSADLDSIEAYLSNKYGI